MFGCMASFMTLRALLPWISAIHRNGRPAVPLPPHELFDSALELSAEEIHQFKTRGYLVKRGLMPAGDAKRAVDRCWELLPPRFDRHRPETWSGPVTDSCDTRDLAERLGKLKFRECLRGERWIYDLLVANRAVRRVVEQLLGPGQVAEPRYVRGFYPIFPDPSLKIRLPRPHLDRHAFQVGVVAYLERVDFGGGGFTVWPGSHRLTYHGFATREDDVRRRALRAKMDRAMRNTAPVEIVGGVGTAVFWHHRLLHAAGRNRSRRVRQAMLGDFSRKDLDSTRCLSPPRDMWEGWAI